VVWPRIKTRLPLEKIDGPGEVGDTDVRRERRVLALQGLEHLPGYAAIAEVAGGSGAKFADVLSFGKIHFEEAADARGQRQQVEGRVAASDVWPAAICALALWPFLQRLVVATMPASARTSASPARSPEFGVS